MNVNEKILLVQILLEDIWSNWDYGIYGRSAEDRATKAKSLCNEIAKELNNDEYKLLADFCDVYIESGKRWDDWNGRFFKNPFPRGYENMNKLHGLKPTIKNKSEEFQSIAKEYVAEPNFRFNDWEDN